MAGGEDLDSLTLFESLKSKNEDLVSEVTFLKKMVSLKNKESSKIKTEMLEQKRVNFELSQQVLKLKEDIEDLKSQNVANIRESEEKDENENHIKPPNILSSSVKCLQVTSSGHSDRKRPVSPTPIDAIPCKRMTRSNFLRLSTTSDSRKTPESKTHLGFDASSVSEQKKVGKSSDSSNVNTSSCSVSGNEVDNGDYLLTKVNFIIVTEENSSLGEPIADLQCAMRPVVKMKQVQKSYCKRMGLDRDRIVLRLVGDDIESEINNDQTVQVCQGKVVAAVRRVEEVQMKGDLSGKGDQSINMIEGDLAEEIATEGERNVEKEANFECVEEANVECVEEVNVECVEEGSIELNENAQAAIVSHKDTRTEREKLMLLIKKKLFKRKQKQKDGKNE